MAFTADAVLDGLHGLCSLRIICKSTSCVKLTCVINADLVAISYVNGSRCFVVVMHVVEISMLREALLGICAVSCSSVACVENCVLCV